MIRESEILYTWGLNVVTKINNNKLWGKIYDLEFSLNEKTCEFLIHNGYSENKINNFFKVFINKINPIINLSVGGTSFSMMTNDNEFQAKRDIFQEVLNSHVKEFVTIFTKIVNGTDVMVCPRCGII